MDFAPLIARKTERFRELGEVIASPSFYENPKSARDVMREHARLKELIEMWNALQKAHQEVVEALALGCLVHHQTAHFGRARHRAAALRAFAVYNGRDHN